MKTLLLYIGSNEQSIAHFTQIIDGELIVVENYTKIDKIIGNRCDEEHVGVAVVFYEQSAVNRDCVGISYLRQKYPCLYVLLVYEKFDACNARQYLHAGVNDTLSATIDQQKLRVAISFLANNQHKLLRLDNTTEDMSTFVLPLWKRCFDIIFALLALVALSPLLILVCIAIRLESKGSVLYKSKRVGSNYKIFDFWKFRSMYVDADKHLKQFKSKNQYGSHLSDEVVADSTPLLPDTGNFMFDDQSMDTVMMISDDCVIPEAQYVRAKAEQTGNAFVKLENDPRITRVGSFIRKYSIDELPQLINILNGDMSVVGNRPLPLYEAEMLTSDEYIDRFMAPSGLTGLWQVEKRGSSGRMSAEERKLLDIKYAQSFSLWFDIKIIFRTFTSFIQKENV